MEDERLVAWLSLNCGGIETSEYIAPCHQRLNFINGFTGSAGTAIVTTDLAALWTDGRYHIQASQQLDENWILMKEGLPETPNQAHWLSVVCPIGSKIGIDPSLISCEMWASFSKSLQGNGQFLKAVSKNLIDEIWDDQPAFPLSPIQPLEIEFTGKTWMDKIADLRLKMQERGATSLVINDLAEAAWLLNLRGTDIIYNPIFFSYILLTMKDIFLFIEKEKITPEVSAHLQIESGAISILPYNHVNDFLSSFRRASEDEGKIWTRKIFDLTPIQLMKAVKVPSELMGMKKCHIRDGIALCQYFCWLDTNIRSGNVTEISGADVLENFRSEKSENHNLIYMYYSSNLPNLKVLRREDCMKFHYAIFGQNGPQKLKLGQMLDMIGSRDSKLDINSTNYGHSDDFDTESSDISNCGDTNLFAASSSTINDAGDDNEGESDDISDCNNNFNVPSEPRDASSGSTDAQGEDAGSRGHIGFKGLREQPYYVGLSFSTISSSGPNGAIIHYSPTKETDRPLSLSEMYLCDSGGQYKNGTTDITRTWHFGNPTPYEKVSNTHVTKGHIALATTIFPRGTKGNKLDVIARMALWSEGLDYLHGTGHGVGSYLNVHEGPMGIHYRENKHDPGIEKDMVMTIEPGFYEKGKFGIRLENVFIVIEAETMYNFQGKGALTFKPISLHPIQISLLETSLLTEKEIRDGIALCQYFCWLDTNIRSGNVTEISGADVLENFNNIKWLNDYHQQCRNTLGPILLEEGKKSTYEWLMKETQPL
ncbi:Xaa-Pro aminopeptidase 1 [Nymphon striatum]|nr:Xaa-Pro aminopeptidase 1 [Nymphon striatum]